VPATIPAPDRIADAAAASPLRLGPEFSQLADADELRYREQIEDYPDPPRDVVRFIEGKELVERLEHALAGARLEPSGTIVELGAGSCWMAAVLARRPAVERVIAVEFSRRRLELLAPIAIAHLDAPAAKIERVVADFHQPGLPSGEADMVVIDSAFHHAADPERLSRVAFDLLRPGGVLLLHREPTLALMRPVRDHAGADEHGSFEHEYWARGYLKMLREAGFRASKVPATSSFRRRRTRAILRPPLSWLNGIAYAEYTYVGVRP
jgi:SAM-dependent methyltransferase